MTYSIEIVKKSISHEVSKQAYLGLCKWLATNVYSKAELSNSITVKIVKETEEQLPTFTATLYYTCDEQILADQFCGKCKQLHSLLYSVQKPNCDECKMAAFEKYKSEYVKGYVQFYKEVFKDK